MKFFTKANQLSTRPGNPDPDPSVSRHAVLRTKPFVFIFLCIIVLFLDTSFLEFRHETVGNEPDKQVPDLIKGISNTLSEISTEDSAVLNGEYIAMYGSVRQFYSRRDFKPAWTSYSLLNNNGAAIMHLIERSREYGLEPLHYHVDALRQLQRRLGVEVNSIRHRQARERTEILLTDAALRFMVNLHSGYTMFDSVLFTEAWTKDLSGKLQDGIEHDRLNANILSVQPRFVEYSRLQQATGNFVRQTELTDEPRTIEKPGRDSAAFYGQVRPVLARLGYVEENCADREIYKGLKQFQKYHGLTPDGKVGTNTLEALAMTSLDHYRMLALNLDRLRKQDCTAIHQLYVNIPAYRLKVYHDNRLEDSYQVIVGNPKTPTPQLTSQVNRIITNPVWLVPKSIIKNEMLEKIKSDTGYLRRNQFRVVDRRNRVVCFDSLDLEKISDQESGYTLRQDAGDDNSLGRVKFIFSNPYLVFMHDTPGKTLFSKDIRALSHGCIRVQDPERLADYMLRTVQADTTNIGRLIEKGVRREFNLSNAIPIRISYVTCDVDDSGGIYFFKDIYGIDAVELTRLSSYIKPHDKSRAVYSLSSR